MTFTSVMLAPAMILAGWVVNSMDAGVAADILKVFDTTSLPTPDALRSYVPAAVPVVFENVATPETVTCGLDIVSEPGPEFLASVMDVPLLLVHGLL